MSGKAAQCKQIIANLCTVCGAGILADNQFCRHCGAHQPEEAWAEGFSSQATVALARPNDMGDPFAYKTKVLGQDFYQEVSIPLIKKVTGQLTSQKTEYFRNPWSQRVLLTLIVVPIWLMIVLLSPLDAYLAAKTTVKRSWNASGQTEFE
jgi:hypothetical protein